MFKPAGIRNGIFRGRPYFVSEQKIHTYEGSSYLDHRSSERLIIWGGIAELLGKFFLHSSKKMSSKISLYFLKKFLPGMLFPEKFGRVNCTRTKIVRLCRSSTVSTVKSTVPYLFCTFVRSFSESRRTKRVGGEDSLRETVGNSFAQLINYIKVFYE